ncbi:MAG: imidazole glycerol phosphate synthase subunit HisF [Nitrososphaerales archaeon]
MLSKRIIPCLDVDRGRVLKGIRFKRLRDAGDPVELACRYRDEGADELVFLDITASVEKREILKKLVKDVASNLDIPFTVGGGIRSIEDAREVLCSGADKVTINTAAVEEPSLISEISKRFGSQCMVVSIDAKKTNNTPSSYEVYTYGARKPTGLDAIEWSKKVEELGAGEILLTSIDRDGTEDGYEINLTKMICDAVNIPVIASGGCGRPEHILEVFEKTTADAALAASIFHYNTYPIPQVKEFLKARGVPVRI